ncbi:hypothetical protein RHGRI_017315 [Rhododendron griersonianum]|uniref:Uncharacterized protein n=1 Tax=Rhododendron griersonianum TaxID=479676 RepID=A0AAV6JXB3_9ERIC|nr:hypothetical protein RHGRI_017315 [Rhododendron griersonianum]
MWVGASMQYMGSYLDEEFCHGYEDQGGLTGLRWSGGPCSGRKERCYMEYRFPSTTACFLCLKLAIC